VIVDPDFFDHWRTRMAADMLGKDEMTPMYIMRLWAHCQVRKSVRIESMPAMGLAALCRYAGDAEKLEAALIASGFIARDGAHVDVLKWAEHNAKLIANWKNGATGGRPKETQPEPTDNPLETQPEPAETQPEPIRLDKSLKADTSQRGSRLPLDWSPSDVDKAYLRKKRPELELQAVSEGFRDYWHAKPGKEGRKLDWSAAWRTWVRNERLTPQTRASPPDQGYI
jgi:hypothetical protein